jgi:hypothetical protein
VGEHYIELVQLARGKRQYPTTHTQRIAAVAARPITVIAKLFRGPNAELEEVQELAPLPETADEVYEIGRRLGVSESEIPLGSNDTWSSTGFRRARPDPHATGQGHE